MADFNYREWADARKASGGYNQASPSSNIGQGMSWNDFYNKYNQVAQANQLIQNGSIDGKLARSGGFRMNGGTDSLYNNKYQKANAADWLAIQSLEGGEWWNNLPGQIAGFFGGDEAKEDWTFDANKFDLSNGLDLDDLTQVRNFAVSIPGMIPGGVLEGFGKAYEAISGRPVQENRETADGYEIADYELDASQRAAAGLDAAINLAGTLTGGSGRAVGGILNLGLRQTAKSAEKKVSKLVAQGFSEKEAKDAAAKELFEKSTAQINKAAKRNEMLEGLSKGWVTRAVETGRGGKPLGTATGLLADMGDEAAEEFVQSYADDVRMKNIDDNSFDRALTGAAWGAAGGLLMGGGGRLLSKVSSFGKDNLENQQDPDETEPYTSIKLNDSFQELATVASQNKDEIQRNDNFVQALEDAHKKRTSVAGSTTVTQSKPDPTLNWDEYGVGVDTIIESFERDDKSAKRVSDLIGTTPEEMRIAIRKYKQNGENIVSFIQAKIDAKIASLGRGSMKSVIGRNPDTKNGGFYLNLTHVFAGRGFATRPEIPGLVGSDWDSDKCSCYFYDPRSLREEDMNDEPDFETALEVRGYPSQILSDPEKMTAAGRAKSNIEWAWAGVGANTRFNGVELYNILSKYMLKDDGSPDVKRIARYIAEFDKISNETDSDEKDAMISDLFSTMIVEQDEMFKEDSRKGSGHNLVTNILNDISKSEITLIQSHSASVSKERAAQFATAIGIDESTEEGAARKAEFEEKIDELERSVSKNAGVVSLGSLNGEETFTSIADAIGFISYLIDKTRKVNPGFRQFGGLRYWINSESLAGPAINLLRNIYGDDNVVATIIREAFKIAAPQEDPTYAIETMCDNLLAAELSEQVFLGSNKISASEGLQNLLIAFKRTQSKYSRIYNKSQVETTNEGDMPRSDSSYKNPLDGRNEGKFESDWAREISLDYGENPDLWRSFARIFGDAELGTIFSDTIINELGYPINERTTINELLDYAASKYTNGNIDMMVSNLENANPDIANFFKNLFKANGSERKAIYSSIEKTIQDVDVSEISREWKNTGKIDKTLEQVLALFDLIYEYVGYENAARLGFVFTPQFFDTKVGQKILEGPDGIMNVIVKSTIYAQYMDPIATINTEEEGTIAYENAIRSIQELGLISPLHQEISAQLLVGDYDIFDLATDLEEPIESTRLKFEDIRPFDSKADFVICGLQTDVGRFSLSSISANTKKAQNLAAKMKQLSYDSMHEEVSAAKKRIGDLKISNGRGLVRFGRYQMENTQMSFSEDMAALNIIAATRLENSQVEKATSQEIRKALYTIAENENDGTLMSLLNRVTSYYSRSMNASAWLGNRDHMLHCIFDPSYSCRVYDPRQGKTVLMTQESLLRDCGYPDFDGDLTDEHLFAIMDKYPQVASYLANPFFKVSRQGNSLSVAAKRDQTLSDAYIDFYNKMVVGGKGGNKKKIDLQKQYNDKLQTVKGWLQTSSQYHKILIAYLSGRKADIFSGKIDYDKIFAYSRDFCDAIARDVLRHLSHESEREIRKAKRASEIKEEVAEEILGIVSSSLRVQEIRWGDSIKDDAVSKLTTNLTADWFSRHIEETFSDDGEPPKIDFYEVVRSSREAVPTGSGIKDITDNILKLYKVAAFSAARAAATTNEYQGGILEAKVDVVSLKKTLIERFEAEGLSHSDATSKVETALKGMRRGAVSLDFSVFRFDDEFFSDSDMRPGNEPKLREKLSKLGYSGQGLDDKVTAFQSLESLSQNERKAEVVKLNNQLIEQYISDIDLALATRNNHNIAGMAEDITVAADKFYEEMELRASEDGSVVLSPIELASLEEASGHKDETDFSWKSLRFWDPIAQSIYTITELETPAGGGSVKVGMNGSEQKYSGPLGHLPGKVSDKSLSYPIYKTAAEVLKMRNKNEMSSAWAEITTIDENGQQSEKIVSLGSQEMASYIEENPEARIAVYDPDENAHGLATYNQLPSAGKDTTGAFHRLSGIWQRVIQFTMEDLVLKYKKKMDPNGTIISPTKSEQIPSSSTFIKDGFAYGDLREKFRKYRTNFITYLKGEFNTGSLDKLGYGEDQARLMVQSITPGILIDFSYDVANEDGSVRKEKGQRFLDASLFVGDSIEAEERFRILTDALGEEYPGFSITRGEIICCTFAELNARLARAVSSRKDASGKITAGAAEEAALEAMANWSDYHESCNGEISMLMRQLPPVGVSSSYEPISITSQKTPMQRFRDIALGGKEGSSHDLSPSIRKNLTKDGNKKANTNYKEAESLGIFDSPLLKVWKKESSDSFIQHQVQHPITGEEGAGGILSVAKLTIEEDGIDNVSDYYGTAILWDSDEISYKEAINWITDGWKNVLYVKEDVFEKNFLPSYRSEARKPLVIDGMKFIPVEATNRLLKEGLKMNVPSSFLGYWNRSSLAMTLVVDKTSQLPNSYPGFKAIPDGGVGVFRSAANDISVEHPPQTVDYSYDDIFGYGYNSVQEKRFMTKDEAKSLREQIAEYDDETNTWVPRDIESWSSIGNGKIAPISLDTPHTKALTRANKLGKGSQEIAEDVIVFLNKIINDDSLSEDNKAFVSTKDFKANEIMTMLYNGDFFAPIYAPSSNVPTDISYTDPDLFNGELSLTYHGTTPVFALESGGVKFSVNAPNESFKGMGFVLEDGLECSSPSVKTKNKLRVKYAIAKQSEDSRAAGIESRLNADALYTRMIMEENMSLFYKFDGKSFTFKEEVFEGWDADIISKFKKGQMTSDDWLKVINGPGIIHGSDRLSRRKNRLICGVIREIITYHAPVEPEIFFGGFKCIENVDEDGNSYLVRQEPAGTGIDGDRDVFPKVMHRLILRNLIDRNEDLFLLFNAVDESLCQNGHYDTRNRNEYLIACDGTTWISFGEDDPGSPQVIRYGENASLGVVMDEMPDINSASLSDQHIMARGNDIGYDKYTIDRAVAANDLAVGNIGDAYSEFLESTKKRAKQRRPQRPKFPLPIELDIRSRLPYATKQDIRRYARVTTLDKNTFTKPRMFFNKKGEKVSMLNAYRDKDNMPQEYQDAISQVNAVLSNGGISFHTLDQLLICYKAVTWTEGMDPEKNVWTSPAKRFKDDAGDMAYNLTEEGLKKNDGLIITAGSSENADPDDRYRRPLLPRALAGIIWNKSQTLRNYWNDDFDSWVARMKEEQKVADQAIDNLSDKRRRNSLVEMSQAAWYSWGEVSSLHTLDSVGMTPDEARKYNKSLASRFAHEYGWTKEDQDLFMKLCEATDEKLVAIRQRYEEINVKKLKYGDHGDEQTRSYTKAEEAKDLVNIANAAAETSQVMALLNPLVAGGNLLDRSLCQSGMRAAIWFGNRLRLGPYKSDRDHIVSKDIAVAAVNDPGSAALYQALRDAEYRSLDIPFIMNLVDNGNIDEAIAYINEKKKADGGIAAKTWGQIKNLAWMSASGANVGTKMQMRLVVDRFVMFIEEDPVLTKLWLTRNSDRTVPGDPTKKMNLLEEVLFTEGFSGLMRRCLTNGSPSFSCFMKAMNSAKRGDMAQKNAVGVILADLCRKIPLGNFFMTTCVSRFPTYSLNVAGRALNYLLPMSSINYAFTNFMAKTEYGKKLGLEETQIHTSMREAMLADICKLGITGTALVLFGLGGAIQPPDDEKKWGNIDEWLVFGTRAGENWYVKDILGMALPMACFWKACSTGQPRFDILMNGMADFLYSNPVVRCGDVVSWLMNPAEALWTDYEEDMEYFQNAKDGGPSFGKWLQCNAFNASMNWATQFITPSILTEVYRSSTDLEKSYKRKWATSASGAITENGQYGQTEMRTYDDAMKHKLTQHNPVLAYLFATLFNEDYLLENMPNTVMYDDFQIEATHGTSISGLPNDQKMAKVADIISVLMGVDDIDAFVKETGFHLDQETLIAVSSQVWDMYHEADEWYNGLQASGQLNYLTLGNGDWDEGKRIAGELKLERDNIKQFWYDFYNNKLKNSTVGKTITMYNRYNTTYATDVNGELYATGIYRSPFNVLPFTNAPGTISNPEGTAGYENDFATISAVTGQPLDSRALIPIVTEASILPAFKELSADKNGNSYSQQYIDTYGNGTASTTTSGYPSGSSRSGYSGGSGGGGGYRRSAGGYSAPSVNLPRSNASRIMNVDRAIKPSYDYLRPDFETKGSREAYRRSDI